MKPNLRLFLIIILGLQLCGCVSDKVQPTVHDIGLGKSDLWLKGDLVLTKRVDRTSGKEQSTMNYRTKDSNTTATSSSDNNDLSSDLNCIVVGVRDVLRDASLITPKEFWEGIGEEKDTLSLSDIFDENYSHPIYNLDLDYLIVAYHQLIRKKSAFSEAVFEGGYSATDGEVAAAVTVDIKHKRIIDATEVDAEYHTLMLHIAFVPFIATEDPKEKPCLITGRRAAEAILQTHETTNALRIAVVAAKANPYSSISPRNPTTMPHPPLR